MEVDFTVHSILLFLPANMSVAPPPLPNAISGFGAQNGTEEQPLAQETEQEDVASVGIIYPPPYIRGI